MIKPTKNDSKIEPTMTVSAIIDHIYRGYITLPEFQRGFVWSPKKVKELFQSLYHGHPIGGILLWKTSKEKAVHRGDLSIPINPVDQIIDGQQRVTTLYSVIKGEVPSFFDGKENVFANLCFNLKEKKFEFLTPNKLKNKSVCVNFTHLMNPDTDVRDIVDNALSRSNNSDQRTIFTMRANNARNIINRKIHVEQIDFENIDVVVDIFKKVNSAGTISPGTVALAKVCAKYPKARKDMKKHLDRWKRDDYDFRMDWLLRSVNTIVNDKSKFVNLHSTTAKKFKDGLRRASMYTDMSLEMISSRLGLDKSSLIRDKMAIPIIVWYLDKKGGRLSQKEEDKLLYWFAQASIWGHFSSSIETVIDQDIQALKESNFDIQSLINGVHRSRSDLSLTPNNFDGSKNVQKFYAILYMITKMGEARDLFSGVKIKDATVGEGSKMERHHIFPKAQLVKNGYDKSEANELANFCFITKRTNRNISDRLPEEYLAEIKKMRPGVLESQWIPPNSKLWKIEQYPNFLKSRRKLLAKEANKRISSLLGKRTK